MSAMRRYLPVFHDVRGARVLVIGAGAVGTRKIEALLESGARVTVVAKEFSPPWRSARRAGISSPFGARSTPTGCGRPNSSSSPRPTGR